MSLDPLKVTDAIKESYKRYLTTAFRLRDIKLRDLFYKEVDKFWFINGPLLEATPPFKTTSYLKDLIAKGIFRSELECFDLYKNPLYTHQEKALRKIMKGRNAVIASGTGSGKTECFLLPIYNHLIKEHKEGNLGPGVRALLLYPMNALANDQLRRLRGIARTLEEQMPDMQITFGRYVGDTPESRREAEEKLRSAGIEPVKSELISREEMRKTPPNILITNYAMLEYLFLRPADCAFFDGEYAGHWKFLVLDEAHIYKGASGIEMAMLMRRLKDRVCEGKEGVLQCIATSATLVKEEEDFGKVAEFAKNLFGEKFEWNPSDAEHQDVIKDERIKVEVTEKDFFDYSLKLYPRLDEIIRTKAEQSIILGKCHEICKEQGISEALLTQVKEKAGSNVKKFLYEILSKDKRLLKLKEILERKPTNFEDCVKQVIDSNDISSEDRQAMKSLVNLAVWVRLEEESLPLLPARYHLFVRAPEGIFASFFPEPKIFLERRKQTDEGYPVFELASCRRCGQEYLIGDIINEKLIQSSVKVKIPEERKRYFLLWQPSLLLEEDEDEEVAIPEEIAEKGKTWKICVRCGSVGEYGDEPKCTCSDKKGGTRLLIEITPKDSILNKCYLCGLRSINIVREFLFQQDAPAAVLTTALFQKLEKEKQKEKKILAFSDSRQDAAFFAPYLDYTYGRILFR